MTKNMSRVDQFFRLILVFAIVVAWYTSLISGAVAIVALTAAGIFFLTSLVGTCPAYLPFGLSTLRRGK